MNGRILLNNFNKSQMERNKIHNEFCSAPSSLTRIEKAWYKCIFNPVNYCQYLTHSLIHNDVPDHLLLLNMIILLLYMFSSCFNACGIPLALLSNVTSSEIAFKSSVAFPIATA